RPSPSPTRCPYTTLFRSLAELVATLWEEFGAERPANVICIDDIEHAPALLHALETFVLETPPNVRFAIAGDTRRGFARLGLESGDRKSTRLNSSHVSISY